MFMAEGLIPSEILVPILIAFGTTLAGLIATTIWNLVKTHSQKIKRAVDREHEDALKYIITDVVNNAIEPFKQDAKEIKDKLDKVADGTRDVERNNIKHLFDKCRQKGYRTDDDTKDFEEMYNSYHNLGGNSFIDDEYEAFRKLELQPNNYEPVKRTNKRTTKKEN